MVLFSMILLFFSNALLFFSVTVGDLWELFGWLICLSVVLEIQYVVRDLMDVCRRIVIRI